MSIVPVNTELAASARSTNRPATRTTPASTVSARASSPSKGQLRKGTAVAADESHFAPADADHPAHCEKPFGAMVTGVGGTGVVTIGALIGMAAHPTARV